MNTGKFKRFNKKQGLPNNTVYGILEDKKGMLWMSTNQGILEFDPIGEKVTRTFDVKDGLQSNEFNSRAYHKGKSGLFYFGGINGITYFYPDSIKTNDYRPPIVFNDFYLNDTLISIGQAPLEQSINSTAVLNLKHYENSFGFQLAVLNYSSPQKNQYAYEMEGLFSASKTLEPEDIYPLRVCPLHLYTKSERC